MTFARTTIAVAVLMAVPSFPASALTVRAKSDLRLWQTVTDRAAPLAWAWEPNADAATLTFSNRLTRAAASVSVARAAGARRGECPHPVAAGEALVVVTLAQTAGGVELVRETAEQTQGRTAIALGCVRDGLHRVQVEDEGCPSLSRLGQSRPPEARDGFVIEATNGTVRICGNDDDVPDGNVTNTCWYGNEAPWQPHFRRGTLFGVYEFLERHAGVRCRYPSCACG